jgi:hypothetical protein
MDPGAPLGCAPPVLSKRTEDFPFEAVRDLVGVCRALYAARQAAGAGRGELVRIERIGKSLTEAAEIARAYDGRRETMAYYSAWKRAQDAQAALGNVVDALMAAEPLVEAAQARVLRAVRGRRAG